jgi:hypothetical protein
MPWIRPQEFCTPFNRFFVGAIKLQQFYYFQNPVTGSRRLQPGLSIINCKLIANGAKAINNLF